MSESAFRLVKRGSRLMIVDVAVGTIAYCPPDFLLPVDSRRDFDPLLDSLNSQGRIDDHLLTSFETRFNPRRGRSRNA